MTSTARKLALSAALAAMAFVAPAQNATPASAATPAPAATTAATPAVAAPAAAPAPAPAGEAMTFLRALEQKNKDLKSLYGSFHQVRLNKMFLEEVQSNGEFWYSKPNRFRCDYHEPSEARFYLLENTGYYYTPELKQVEKFRLEGGDSAPINQMLVGFGLSVDKILDVFNVSLASPQPADKAQIVLDFDSKDTERTLDYKRIRITFDREKLEPRVLEIEEEDDSIKVTLQKIQPNAEVPADQFKTDFPAGVEIVEY